MTVPLSDKFAGLQACTSKTPSLPLDAPQDTKEFTHEGVQLAYSPTTGKIYRLAFMPKVFDNETGKPLNIPTRLNCKVVKRSPAPTPYNPSPASWYEVLLALLMVFVVAVAVVVSGVNP